MTRRRKRHRKPMRAAILIFLIVFGFDTAKLSAAPRAELWARWQEHDPVSTHTIDHSQWDAFLQAYVVEGHPSGINRVRYSAVTADDRRRLRIYLDHTQTLPISTFSRREQLAYWINLYNAATVNVVLENFPVDSIRNINLSPGLFSRIFGGGPWRAKLLQVEGQELSLDDIEHRILRPIWRDNRIHYAVNCASLGCPNLQQEAFTADNTERLLQNGAHAYVNHPRGVSMRSGKLRLSSIYDWYREDFGGNTLQLLAHLRKHARPSLRRQLEGYRGDISYAYDWSLNDARAGDGT